MSFAFAGVCCVSICGFDGGGLYLWVSLRSRASGFDCFC